MAEKVAKLGIARDKDFMFYVKDGQVWRVKRKQPGASAKGKPEQVADGGFVMDSSYIYFVDRDGDVSRAQRKVGGQKRKKPKRAKAAKRTNKTSKTTKKTTTRGTRKLKSGRRLGPKPIKAKTTKGKAAARKKRP